MMQTRSPLSIPDLGPGDHLCCLYETEEEHRAVLTPFLRQGLERREKVLYIVDAREAKTILDYLRDAGLDVGQYLARGQLVILSRDDAYTRDGLFDPDGMIALLQTETQQSVDEGYSALRVTGEMTWALRGLPGSERLIEYEGKLNEFFPGSRCLAICQYDRRRFDPAVLLDVLRTHPIAVIGTEVCDNFYYISPADLLRGDSEAATLRNSLEHLVERKRADEALWESQEQYRDLYENAPIAYFAVGVDGLIRRCSRRVQELLGYAPEELVGRPVFDLYADTEMGKARAQEVFRRFSAGEEVFEEALQMMRADGTPVWISLTVNTFRNAHGEVVESRSMVMDVTERKRAEEAQRRLNRSLEEANRHKSEFLANLSHELRTPLNAVLGASELLAEGLFGGLNEKQEEYVRDIHESGDHLLSLINDVLDLSKVEAGKVALHLSQFDVRSLMESSAVIVRERAASKSLEFKVIPPPEEIVVEADERKVKQIVYNLLSNAVKFTPERGRVVFRAHRDGGEAVFAVEDSGPGVAEEFRERVFEEFFQTPDSQEGTGLGLALSKRLVELHGGRIWLESQVGQGCRLFFAIPIERLERRDSGGLRTVQ